MSYREDIKKYKILTLEEETNLFNEYISNGSASAFNTLINHNLANVRNLCLAFYRKNDYLEIDELVGNGNEALVNCVRNFKPNLGNRFYTYLSTAIVNCLVKAINEQKNVPLPLNKVILFGKIAVNGDESFNDKQKREYELFSNYLYVRFSDDTDDEDNYQFDIEDEQHEITIYQDELLVEINQYMTYLKEDEQLIINHFYGLNGYDKLKLLEISDLFNCSKTKISSIKHNAMITLRNKVNPNE